MQHGNLQSPFWELLPNEGLEPIRFLMGKSEVQDYYMEVGSIICQKNESLEQKKKDLQDTFNQFSEFFSEDDFKNVMEGLQIVGEELDDLVTEYRDSGISFTYKADQLTEIFADDRARQLHFQGIPVFPADPKQLLAHMSKIFKEDPLIKDEELIFPGQRLYLFSFVKEKGNGDYTEGDKRNRTIMWRNSPRPFSAALSEYRPIKLIKE